MRHVTALTMTALLLGCFVPIAGSASPTVGRWEGRTKEGGRIAFVVAYQRGHRVVASPSIVCAGTRSPQVPGNYQAAKLETFVQYWGKEFPSRSRRVATARLRADGSFKAPKEHPTPLGRQAFSGRLSSSTGRIETENGNSSCDFRGTRVRLVSRKAYADGIYLGLGAYLTKIELNVYSGGGTVEFDPNTDWGGYNPRIAADLGPEAGMLACLVSYGPGALATAASGSFQGGGRFAWFPDPLAALFATGRFASTTTIVGTYKGLTGAHPQSICPFGGVFAAKRAIKPGGAQLSYRPPHGAHPAPKPGRPKRCVRVDRVVDIAVSRTRYPAAIAHIDRAINRGWPRILVLNKPGAKARRRRALRGIPTKPGVDRDEYPPAFLRGRGPGLTRGRHPTGWMADVEYVPSAQNQAAGASQGNKLRRYCNGQRVTLIGY